jgi:hypothetical protein
LPLLQWRTYSEKRFGERTPRKPTPGELARQVSQLLTTKAFLWLPLYDYFKIQREGEELQQLKVLWKEYGAANCPIPKDPIDLLWRLLRLLESEGANFLGDCIP